MARTQADVGGTLAQLYDVEGGQIASSAEINDHEIQPVHELGGQILAERMTMQLRVATSGVIAQNTAWEAMITDVPGQFKILGIIVSADVGTRILHANVSLDRNDLAGTGHGGVPIWVYDNALGTVITVRIPVGGAATDLQVLLPSPAASAQWPQRGIVGSIVQPVSGGMVDRISFRGVSTAFGAGTVTTTATILMSFFNRAAGSGLLPSGSRVPFPSW